MKEILQEYDIYKLSLQCIEIVDIIGLF
jgi:hypothetical protein